MINILTSDDYRKLTERTLNSINTIIALIKDFMGDIEILDKELILLCPQSVGRLEMIFQLKKGIKRKRKFNIPSLRNVYVKPVISFIDVTHECIRFRSHESFVLLYDKLSPDTPYIFGIEFDIADPKFIKHLVHRKVQEDALEEHRRYWLHAQLRFVKGLEKIFPSIRINDLDFDVTIAVHEDVRVSIPSMFKKELEVIVKWLSETQRERKQELSLAHLKLLRKRSVSKGDILNLLKKLQELFLPMYFKRFIEVRQDFQYYDCKRGTDYYSAPFPTWPKFMIVITRTDLSIDKPVTTGYLDFRYRDFRKEIEKLFDKYYS